MRNTIVRLLALLFCVALATCLCTGCGSSRGVDSHTDGYDTAENLALFMESPLYALAKGWRTAERRAVYSGEEAEGVYFAAASGAHDAAGSLRGGIDPPGRGGE